MADKKNEASSGSGISESVVSDFGRRRTSCRHCKSRSDVRITQALRAQSLTVYDFQALIDRGWVRSGCSLLKPEMETTCCPCYPIRLKASDFVPSKAQVQVSKRMQRFLDGSLNVKKPDEQIETSCDSSRLSNTDSVGSVQTDVIVDRQLQMNKTINYLCDQIDSVVLTCTELGEFPSDIQFSKASVKSVAPTKRIQAAGTQDLLYTSNICFYIAADIRRASKGISTEKDPKYTAEVLSSHLKNTASAIGLLVKAWNGHINFYSTETCAQADLVAGRPAVSKDSSSTDSGKLYVKKQNLEIRLKRSSFDPEEYALYRRYVIKRHNYKPDHVTESSYKKSYVDSPLIFVPSSGDITVPPSGFGSFHQQYLINGKLVAVVVIDILPKYLVCKYLFYDPDLAFLSLGTYCLLQGINWVKETQNYCPSLQYSNLGYYIHSIKNMRYKAEYSPSELLCPRRYQWVSFDIAKRLLDKKAYVVLSDFATLQYKAPASPNVIDDQIEQENEPFPDESNDIRIYPDEEMSEIAFEDSGDSSGPETTSLMPAETREDVSNIVIGLKGMHLTDKFDIHQKINRLMEGLLQVTLVGRIYSCKDCKTHLALCDDVVSKEFHCNNGKAYLFTKVVNVTAGVKEDRMMMTGLHTVADIFCIKCGINVGWRYETAHEENQKYMEGKSVLERFKLSGPDEINGMVSHNANIGGHIHKRKHMEGLLQVTLEGKIYSCKDCKTHLALADDIVSKGFYCKNGKAYLFTKVVNVTVGVKEDRMMMTGLHTVADISCVKCGSNVGWTYETAHENNQKYKEGKSILERVKLSGPDEINDSVTHEAHSGGSDQGDA
uniref:arginyltransferase n=1 Tax=Tanacetum cinerariifolium TaxID=118510 RepID=A0A6L2L1F8_TANCI|nr:acyl-CoA N-acyltransferase [Tanacetum cinerariifolium]